MFGIFGLAAALIGFGVACSKSEKDMRSRRDNAQRIYGDFISTHDRKPFVKARQKEVFDYFDSRVSYYYTHPENIHSPMYPEEARKVKGIQGDYILRSVSGWLACKDVYSKYCPNYEALHGDSMNSQYMGIENYRSCGAEKNLLKIIVGLARIDIYNAGGVPGHMSTRQSPLYGRALWFNPREEGYFANMPEIYWKTKDDPKWSECFYSEKFPNNWWQLYAKYPDDKLKGYKELLDSGMIK